MPFDYAAARNAGYSDDEILDHLSKETPDFDIKGAVESGYSPGEISRHLSGIDEATWARQSELEATRKTNLETKGDFSRGLSSATDALQASGYGMAALAGEGLKRLGAEKVGQFIKDKGMEGYKRNMEEASLNPAVSFTDIDSVGSAVDWAQGGIGSLIPSMAEAATGAVIGSFLAPGAGTAAGGLATRTVLKKSIDKLTKEALESQIKKGLIKEGTEAAIEAQIKNQVTKQSLKALGGKVGMGSAVLPIETGGNYAGLLEENGVDAPYTALGFGTLATALEYLPGGNSKLIDTFLGAATKGYGGLAKRTAKEILTGIPSEALQEAGQEVTSILNTVVNTDEKFLTPENLKTIINSGAVGALAGGFGGAAKGLMSKPADNDIATALKTGDDQALDQELDKILSDQDRAPAPFADIQDQTENLPAMEDEEYKQWEAEIQRQRQPKPQRELTPQEINQARIGMTDAMGKEIENIPETDGSEWVRMEDEANADADYWNKTREEILKQREQKRPSSSMDQKIRMAEDIGREIEDIPEVRTGYSTEQEKLDTERDIFLQKLDQMQNEVNGSRTRGVTQEKINQPEAIAFPADSPEWMREVQEARKKDGKSALGRADLNTLFDKVRSGKPLTENQQDQFNYVQRAAQKYAGPAGEMVAQEEADSLEKRGFDLLGGRKMEVVNFGQGDRIVATVDGVKDEYLVKDMDENGKVILEDGVTRRVDLNDEISVEAHKPATHTMPDGTVMPGVEHTGQIDPFTDAGKMVGGETPTTAVNDSNQLPDVPEADFGESTSLPVQSWELSKNEYQVTKARGDATAKSIKTASGSEVIFWDQNRDFPGDYDKKDRAEIWFVEAKKKGEGKKLLKAALNEVQSSGAKTVVLSPQTKAGKGLVDSFIKSGILGQPIRSSESGKLEFNISGIQQESSTQDITTTSGKPFTSKGSAIFALKRAKADKTHEPVKVDGGWVGREIKYQTLQTAPESGKVKPADRLKALFQSKKEKQNGRTLAQKRTSPERDGRAGKTDIEESAREKFQRLFGRLDKSGKTRLIAPLRKDLRQLQKVVELFGKKAYFFTTDAENLKGTNGFTNPKGGNEIFINARATEPLISIAGHELIHQLKNDHKDLYDFLLNTIRVSDSNFKKYVENLNKNREEFQKVTDVDQQYEEFIGDFAADNFPKVEFWGRMMEQNAPLTKRIIKVLETILNKIKSYFSRAERYISNVDESMDALAYAMGEAMRRAKDGNVKTDETGKPSYMFAGPEASTADKGKAFEAQQMRDAGVSRKEVWDKTGWWEIVPGSDVWSFEIDDSGVSLKTDKIYSGDTDTKLSDVVDAPTLFKEYPFLKRLDAVVTIDPKASKPGGSFGPSERDIKVTARDEKQARVYTVHEMQHAVQDYEDFQQGGNPGMFAPQKIESKEVKSVKNKIDTLLKGSSSVALDFRKKLRVINDELYNKENGSYNKERLNNAVDYMNRNHAQKYKQYLKLKSDLKSIEDSNLESTIVTPGTQYLKLTGEAQARLTERRLNMTDKQRKAEPPWITLKYMMWEEGLIPDLQTNPEDVLISRDGDGAAFSVAPATESKAFRDWFGESVVTVDGKAGSEPLVVYHGTANSFNAFDKGKIHMGVGFFFTPSKRMAQQYADKYVGKGKGTLMPVYLSAKKFIDLSTETGRNVSNSIKKSVADSEGRHSRADYIAEAQRRGYDGRLLLGGLKGGEIEVFEPTQIKSVFNRGTFDPKNPDIRYQVMDKATAYEENRKNNRNIKTKAFTSFGKFKGELVKGVDKFLGSISTRLKLINKKLAEKIRTLDYDINTKYANDIKIALPLLEKAKKMTRDDYADWDFARKNSDGDKLKELNEKYGMVEEYKAVREMLDRIRKEAIDVGYEVGEIEEYWPRVLKDQEGFLKAIDRGPERPEFTDALKKKAKDMGIEVWELDPMQRADIISNMILGKYYGIPGPGSVKQRFFDTIPVEFNRFYMDSDAALMNHLHSMRKRIEARKFFGKVPEKITTAKQRLRLAETKLRETDKNDTDRVSDLESRIAEYRAVIEKYKNQNDFTDNIGSYIDELIVNGDIKPEQENTVKEILTARFNERGATGNWQAYKNFSYMDTMGSPISAITQIGDLAWSMYEGGVFPTVRNVFKSITNKSRITKEDVGVERIAQEFADSDTLSNAVSKVFKWVGLEKMDSIGKEALLNTAFEKFKQEAAKNPTSLKQKIRPIFENETGSVIQDLLNDDVTENVKRLVYGRLLDFQPVGLSEMPEKYLTAGNGRVFYMLKTFTLKQFDIFRREVYHDLKNGNAKQKAEAMKRFVYLSSLFVLANAGADELKDWLLGRNTDLSDRVVDNVLRLFGVSKFVTWKARTEGVGSAMTRQILPPFKFIDALTKDVVTAGDDKGLKTIESIPVVGKLAYWHMGRGANSENELWDTRLSKEKARLNKVEDRLERAKNKQQFIEQNRSDLAARRKINKMQGKLNMYRKRINNLKKQEQTKEVVDRIEKLENTRTGMIKKYFGKDKK